MKIMNGKTDTLFIDRFSALNHEAWCIFGSNHSGMDDFFRLICGEHLDITADCLMLPENPGIVSFKKQQALYESELKKDDTDFLDKIDPGTPAREFIRDIQNHAGLIAAFNMTSCLDKGYRQLSTGQSRKLMLLSQFSKGISCLIIESPYEGLDPRSREEVDKALCHLHRQNVLLILFVANIHDIPCWCTHSGMVSQGRFILQGPRQDVQALLEHEAGREVPDFKAGAGDIDEQVANQPETDQPELIFLENGFAGYGGHDIFQGLTLTLHQGEHTLVTGPNGSGKSTLLQVITGDHPACYQNNLRVFGVQRGSGESIWDLKKQMGIVSSDLHRNYVVPGSTLSCILSGFFDSIGVYQAYTRQQELLAMKWLERIGMTQKARTAFRDLNFADQRLVLIARALIKMPRLLVLDEPTQGLDGLNRKAVLDFIEFIAKKNICTILYVSHREDEFRDFFVQQIKMGGIRSF
ncbi:MAG: ATP-binding cassette domain-containing protein [Proteobacteria bacterium]|nr:ATP-binding cassette domain-containing protein [Pseudomonadota bacterium]MBU1586126.1 ATP-binding cassette domain-containing protein [Pseudomonadota bacterium]MBU2627381.1 ATP-binding cassette domain-containing protein [Pseudomonadota bacterium]